MSRPTPEEVRAHLLAGGKVSTAGVPRPTYYWVDPRSQELRRSQDFSDKIGEESTIADVEMMVAHVCSGRYLRLMPNQRAVDDIVREIRNHLRYTAEILECRQGDLRTDGAPITEQVDEALKILFELSDWLKTRRSELREVGTSPQEEAGR